MSELAARRPATRSSCASRCRRPTRTARARSISIASRSTPITVGARRRRAANRDLLIKARVVGTIAVKPPPVEGEAATPASPAGQAAGPGDRVTFVEELTDAKLTPVAAADAGARQAARPPLRRAADARRTRAERGGRCTAAGAAGAAPSCGQSAPAAARPDGRAARRTARRCRCSTPHLRRSAASTRSGRAGRPSTRVRWCRSSRRSPRRPRVAARMPTEKAVVVDWTPPVAERAARRSRSTSTGSEPRRTRRSTRRRSRGDVRDCRARSSARSSASSSGACRRSQNVTVESDRQRRRA